MTACDPPEEGADDEGFFAEDEDPEQIRPRCLINGVCAGPAAADLPLWT